MFIKRKPSEYLSIFNNNIEAIAEDYISGYIDLVKSILNILIFATALLIFVDLRITLVVIIASVLAAFVPIIMQSKLSKSRKDQFLALGHYFSKVTDLLTGKKRINPHTVNAFVKEHTNELNNSERKRLIFGKIKTKSDMLNAIGVFVIELSTFSIVAYLLVKREISIGTGIAAFGYVTSFLTPIRNILMCINCINSTKDTVEETISFLNSKPLNAKNNDVSAEASNLTLTDVTFETEQFSIEPLTFKFNKGGKYVVVGHSGSGKSTLLKMIDGTIDNTSGIICIDGMDINSLDRNDYIFSIDQFEHMFNANFISNITIFNSYSDVKGYADNLLGKLNPATRERIESYNNINQLSGGEKQIIYLLRMLIADRPIILLDESYSGIDRKSISLIKDYVMSLSDKIIIEVTHDVSPENLSKYDSVINLDDGVAFVEESYDSDTN